MSVNLQKGQKVDLTKGNAGLKKIVVGLGWDAAEGAKEKRGLFSRKPKTANIDCDASAILLKSGNKLMNNKDIIYFGNLKHASGSVVHMGDNLTGDGNGDDEQIIIDLSSVPADYEKIVIVANIYHAVERKQHFGMIKNAFIRIVNMSNHQEMCKYNLSENYDNMTAMVFGEVYRYHNEWKFNAIGQPTQDKSLSELIVRIAQN